MRIYVTSSPENIEPVRKVMQLLQEHGHETSFDWTQYNDPEQTYGGKDRFHFLRDLALTKTASISTCDTLLLLNQPDCKGAYTEMGIALGCNKPVIVIDSSLSRNIFYYHPMVLCVGNMDVALHMLSLIKKGRKLT